MGRPAYAGRPRFDIADIVRRHRPTLEAEQSLTVQQRRALSAIELCRTAALGGHVEECRSCGYEHHHFHSCRNRHCPKCQALAQQRWIAARTERLLAVRHFHVVFTLPSQLRALTKYRPRELFSALFASASATLLELGHSRLEAQLGITMVLHTWGQRLDQHIHVHCVVTGGALSPDGERWIPAKPGFLFPVRALSAVFRAKYIEALAQAYQHGELHFAGSTAPLDDPAVFRGWLATLKDPDWVVYAKPPFAGAQQVLAYLGRYTHRVAIANHRLVSFEDGQVRLRWRDYAHGNASKTMTLSAEEFLRRFLLHTLQRGFVRIRHYGLLGNRCRHQKLARCRALLDQPAPEPCEPESPEVMMLRLTGIDIQCCPACQQGRLRVINTFAPTPSVRPTPKATGPPP